MSNDAARAWALPAQYRATLQVACQGDLATLVRQANLPAMQVGEGVNNVNMTAMTGNKGGGGVQ